MVCEAPCRKENTHLHIWCLDLFFPVLIYSQLNPPQWGGGIRLGVIGSFAIHIHMNNIINYSFLSIV